MSAPVAKSAGEIPTGASVPTSALASAPTPHVWERWFWVWNVVFYGTLLVSTALALASPQSWTNRGATLGLTLLLGAWYAGFIVMHPHWVQRTAPMLIFLAGAWALWAGLTAFHPAYMLVTFSLYVQVFSFLPFPWAIPGAVALTSLLVVRNADMTGQPWDNLPFLAGASIATAFGIVLALYIDRIIRQSQERHDLVERLEALALENQQLLAQARHTGVLEERQRMAREIHDTLAQGLTSIVLHLEAAEQSLPGEANAAHQHILQARRTARESLTEVRRSVWALRPEPLERSSLPDALARVVANWSEASGIPASTFVTGTVQSLPAEAEVTLLRVAQEALANVRKHAGANQVSVTLSCMDDLTILDVQDDGVGFNPGEVCAGEGYGVDGNAGTSGGFGLTGMRERVELLGGRLSIESAPGQGTTVTAALPTFQPEDSPSMAVERPEPTWERR